VSTTGISLHVCKARGPKLICDYSCNRLSFEDDLFFVKFTKRLSHGRTGFQGKELGFLLEKEYPTKTAGPSVAVPLIASIREDNNVVQICANPKL